MKYGNYRLFFSGLCFVLVFCAGAIKTQAFTYYATSTVGLVGSGASTGLHDGVTGDTITITGWYDYVDVYSSFGTSSIYANLPASSTILSVSYDLYATGSGSQFAFRNQGNESNYTSLQSYFLSNTITKYSFSLYDEWRYSSSYDPSSYLGFNRFSGTNYINIDAIERVISYSYTSDQPPETPTSTSTPNFSSIYVSTSTSKVNLQGYWETGNRISFFSDSSIYGGNNFDTRTATSSGVFNLNFDYVLPTPLTLSTTTPNIVSSLNFYGVLDDMSSTIPIQLDFISTTLQNTGIGSDLASTTAILNYPEPSDCGITNIGGCIKNVIVWAFFPSKDTLNLFTSLRSYITIKAPIGYFVGVQTGLTGLSTGGTKAFNVTIPLHIKETFINPFDIAIAGILWFYFIINFYRRLKHIQL